MPDVVGHSGCIDAAIVAVASQMSSLASLSQPQQAALGRRLAQRMATVAAKPTCQTLVLAAVYCYEGYADAFDVSKARNVAVAILSPEQVQQAYKPDCVSSLHGYTSFNDTPDSAG